MKRLIIVTICVVLSAGLLSAGTPEGKAYGDGVTLEKAVPIKTLLEKPDDYVGKSVRVEGTITGMCKKRGCWMQLNDDEGNAIRIKVEDGVIVFPYTSMGNKAVAQGVFEAIKLSPEQIAAKKKAAAEHAKSEGCDKSEEHAKGEQRAEGAGCDAPVHHDRVFLIRGTGAIIKG